MTNPERFLERSAVDTAYDDAKERQSFRFPFRGVAHKPLLQFVLECQPRRVSSLIQSNLFQGFLPNPLLNRVTGRNRLGRPAGQGMEPERATNRLNKAPKGGVAGSPREQTRRAWATMRRGRKHCERHTAYRNVCANTGDVLESLRASSVPTPAPEMKVNSL